MAWRSLWRPTSLQNSILSMSASTRQFVFPSKVLVTNGAIGLWKQDGNFVLTEPVVLSTDVEFRTTDGDYGFVVEESQTIHRQPTESSRLRRKNRSQSNNMAKHDFCLGKFKVLLYCFTLSCKDNLCRAGARPTPFVILEGRRNSSIFTRRRKDRR